MTRLADNGSSVWLVEIVVESCSCGLASMMGRRICASVVAAGPQPALGEVTASSQDSDRGHDVSILMASDWTGWPMTRRGATLENLDSDHATAAARAGMRGGWRLVGIDGISLGIVVLRHGHGE